MKEDDGGGQAYSQVVGSYFGAWDRLERCGISPIIPLPLGQDALRQESTDIFYWVLANHEGQPPEPIYDDEWIAECLDYTDESDAGVEGDAGSNGGS